MWCFFRVSNKPYICGVCGKIYTNVKYTWCKPCQTNYLKKNFTNWTSKNEDIDDLIQKIQLKWAKSKFTYDDMILFEWIPYNQFIDVKEICEDGIATARWKNGPLHWDMNKEEWTRDSDEAVVLECLNIPLNTPNIKLIIQQVKVYFGHNKAYGISQNPDTKDYIIVFNKDQYFKEHCKKCVKQYTDILSKWCEPCQMNYLKENFANWTSGNETIDNLIKEMQLNVNDYNDTIFEWIPYNQFDDIKKIGKSGFVTARWKNGPLYWRIDKTKYMRNSDKSVTLKCLDNTQNITNEFLNEVCGYLKTYGISQNPNTKDYIMIFNDRYFGDHCEKCIKQYTDILNKWCEPCQMNYLKENFANWTSGNEKIDNLIKEMQLNIKDYNDTIFEWIPYNQFDDIKEIGKGGFVTAKWRNGPLYWRIDKTKYMRNSNKTVTLKYLDNRQNITNEFLNEVYGHLKTYGISQNPNTKDYIMVFNDQSFEDHCEKCIKKYTEILNKWCESCQMNNLKENFANWTSDNEKIDNLIQEIQLNWAKVQFNDMILFEWIPYNQLIVIKEINKGSIATASWMDGPLHWNKDKKEYIRDSNKTVTLKYFNNSQNFTNEFLNKVKAYCCNFKAYGISQNLNTKDYIMIFNDESFEDYCEKCVKQYADIQNKWCKLCQINYLRENFTNWTSDNEEIDNIIQEVQLKIINYHDTIFEWIPYDQFNDIKKMSKGGITIARWNDGPLYWNKDKKKYTRNSHITVILKYFDYSQNITKGFLDEVKKYYNNYKVYGISQNPDTKDYVFIFNKVKFQITYLKEIFTSQCENEEIDNLILEMQLQIDDHNDIVFEWIPYNQFEDIKKIGKGGFATVYSAIWKNGPLYWDMDKKGYARDLNKTVALKCLDNSQNITGEFLNEVKAYLINNSNNFDNTGEILKIYGISRNPNTKNYIIVLQYAQGGNFNDWLNNNYKYFNWVNKLKVLINIINGLKKIHQNQMIHRDFHVGNILFKDIFYWITSNYISDMGLCGEVDNIDKTKIYGVMPYVAPEVLRGKSSSQAADIYSFGMIMYFVATERQPFANCAHDELLALNICEGVRPEINESETPECYINLMKKCWNSSPNNRPNTIEIEESIKLFYNSYCSTSTDHERYKIEMQFKEAEKRRTGNKNDKTDKNNLLTTHPQAIYTSRILNPFTKDLPKYTDNTECLDCEI
ncbi:hypothetical protein C1645_819749 [Glomus cerebriforme]|uniref:Protein kinase domain-containing protein n=1 Tax=Glomus cerebriforme TaxID=658196 RepID=A0A397T9R2_9GLOM|nr:hypothetical protein C1645_819749 [Glomus cerebriforme]